MKTKIIFLLLFILLIVQNTFSQFDDILKKIPGVGDVFKEAVTTSIKDAYPTAYWLKDLDKQVNLNTGVDYNQNLSPGLYKFDFKTFCLHAGAYSPTEGAGYLVAPLKGAKSKLIKSVLSRYGEHPDIDQKDVQMLIWGIEANQKFSNYPADFQMRVAPLLTPEEIALMEVDTKEIAMDLLPQDVKDVLHLYSNLRDKMSNPMSTFEDIEQIAVKTGIAPIGKGSKNIDAGVWTSIGNGTFIRCYPHGYRQTDVEVYVPSDVTVKRDDKNRIVSLDDGTNKIEMTYDESPGANALNGQYPLYRFKALTVTGDETMTFDDKGWYIPSLSKVSGQYSRNDDPSMQEYNERKQAGDEFIKNVKKSMSKKRRNKVTNSEWNNLAELKQLELSLKPLLGIDELNGSWYEADYKLAVDAVSSYISGLSGSKTGGSRKTSMDINGLVFAPANTSNQRLGIGNGGPSGGPPNPPPPPKKKKNCNPTVKISRVNYDYLPEPGTSVSANLNIQIEGDADCKVEGVKYTLFQVTREPGRYMNDKDPAWYDTRLDLYFDPGQNSSLNISSDSLTAQSSSEVTSITVSCNDYGAFGKLKAEVKIDGTWYAAKDETTSLDFVSIPLDDDLNHIADKWETDNNVKGLPAVWDEEDDPSGQKRDGDGMTNYEEYRGFYAAVKNDQPPQYMRMNPKIKELFVIDEGKLLPKTPWQVASGIRVYYLTQNEVYGNLAGGDVEFKYRWVDFCSNYAKGNKYAINIIKVNNLIDPYNYYPWPSPALAYADPQGCKSPKECKRVVVFPERVRWGLVKLKDTLNYLVSLHPLQSTIEFNGNTLNKTDVNELTSFLGNSATFELFLQYQMTLSMIHEIGHAIGLPHHTGSKQEWSGEEYCPMRYIDINDQIKWVAFLKTVSGPDNFTQWEFCKSPDNCWSKISVNDR